MPQAVIVIAAVVAAAAAVDQGVTAKKTADAQARFQDQQADREKLDAANAEQDFRRQQSRLLGTRRASLAATGVDPGTGSPLLVSEDFAGEAELQALRIRSGGDLRSTRLEQQAQLNRFAGKAAQTQGFVRGGSLLVSGAGQGFAGPTTGPPGGINASGDGNIA